MIAGSEPAGAFWARLPVFAYGFRTFFLLAAAAATGLIAIWLAVLIGGAWSGTVSAVQWHAHEMLFGFVGAAVAGFLLTAVPSWTGMPAIAGMRLAFLALLWLAGRIASAPPFADSPVAAAIDIGFDMVRYELLAKIGESVERDRQANATAQVASGVAS